MYKVVRKRGKTQTQILAFCVAKAIEMIQVEEQNKGEDVIGRLCFSPNKSIGA